LAIDRLLASQRVLEEQLRTLRSGQLRREADELAAGAEGRVVARRDGLEAGELRDLAIAVRDHPGVDVVGLVGATGADRVAVVVAARKESGIDARPPAVAAASAVGGGGGGTPELATAGGRNVAGIEEALRKMREALDRGPGEPEAGGQASD
jgi:alanyl-tRNA synthetase